jgi:hypothetical protein
LSGTVCLWPLLLDLLALDSLQESCKLQRKEFSKSYRATYWR